VVVIILSGIIKKNHTRNVRLTDAAWSTQQTELVFHNSVPAE
jgi:hypothetical protein